MKVFTFLFYIRTFRGFIIITVSIIFHLLWFTIQIFYLTVLRGNFANKTPLSSNIVSFNVFLCSSIRFKRNNYDDLRESRRIGCVLAIFPFDFSRSILYRKFKVVSETIIIVDKAIKFTYCDDFRCVMNPI